MLQLDNFVHPVEIDLSQINMHAVMINYLSMEALIGLFYWIVPPKRLIKESDGKTFR